MNIQTEGLVLLIYIVFNVLFSLGKHLRQKSACKKWNIIRESCSTPSSRCILDNKKKNLGI